MTALLSANAGKTEKVALYVADARSMGVPVLAPEINASSLGFLESKISMTSPISVLAWVRSKMLARPRWN